MGPDFLLKGQRGGEAVEDWEIVALFWDRDEGAIPAAQGRYGAWLLRLAEQLLHSRQDAEECVNDAWLNAWNAIPPERPDNLMAYLTKICRNLALDRLDRRNAQKRRGQVLALTEELESCIPDTLRQRQAADREELGALLTSFLQDLSEEPRRMFLRRYWFGDPIRDIARRCGCGESRVKVTLLRTRNRLRDYLEQEGITV